MKRSSKARIWKLARTRMAISLRFWPRRCSCSMSSPMTRASSSSSQQPCTSTFSPAPPSVRSVLPRRPWLWAMRLEADDLGAGKVGFEAEDVVDLCAAPAIDRLIVVTDAADIAAPLGKKPEPQILGDVGVLIFVDQHEQEALLILPEHVGVFLEQPQIFQQQVAEIDGVQLLESLLIDGIELAALAVGKGERFALWHALRNKPAVLPAVDHGREHARRPSLLVDVLGVKQLLEQP